MYRIIPSEINPETSWLALIHQENKKKPTLTWVGKPHTQSHHKPQPWHSDTQLGGNSQLPASLWRVKGLNPTVGTTTLKTATWEMDSQTIYLWKPMGLACTYKITVYSDLIALKRYLWTHHGLPPGPSSEAADSNKPNLPGKKLFAYLKALAWGAGQFNTVQKLEAGVSSCSPSASLQVVSISQKGAHPHVWCPSFCRCCPEEASNGAYICGYQRTVTNRETVLNQVSLHGTAQRQQIKHVHFFWKSPISLS